MCMYLVREIADQVRLRLIVKCSRRDLLVNQTNRVKIWPKLSQCTSRVAEIEELGMCRPHVTFSFIREPVRTRSGRLVNL